MNEKGLWLIDAGYLFNGRRTIEQDFEIDYLKLKAKIEQESHVTISSAYYLNSITDSANSGVDGFHKWLESPPPKGPDIRVQPYPIQSGTPDNAYCTICHEVITPHCPKDSTHRLERQKQKGVDVGIATLALVHQDKYDTLILSSGDGDLLDPVEHLSKSGKRIILAVFDYGVSGLLRDKANQIIWLDDFAEEIRRHRS